MLETGYLGIDVSKGYADFVLMDKNGNVSEDVFQLADSKQGRQKLKEVITCWHEQGLTELFCGVESTGGYENNWYTYLRTGFKDKAVYVCRINPKGVKSIGEASLNRTVTDAVSAENIATYMISFSKKLDYGINDNVVNDDFKEGRQHATCIRMHQKQKVQLNNQLEKLLYQYFGEMLIYCRHGMPAWLLNMLVKYPTASMAIEAGSSQLAGIKSISQEKAKAIIAKAGNNTQDVSRQVAHIISVTAREVLHKEELIKQEKKYLTAIHKDTDEVKLLQDIPGIGIDSAVSIALEIEAIERFESAKKLAAFFGTHPTFKQSGDGMWGNHMSKKGRGEIRAVLYMAALTGIRHNPILKQVYVRSRSKGMKHYPAMGVTMHKLLRIVYGVLKNKTKFDAKTDEQNQQRSAEKQHNNEQVEKTDRKIKKQSKHRFQDVSTDAPISKRREQRIRKQVASQASN